MRLSDELKHCLYDKNCSDCRHYEADTKATCKGLLEKAYERIKRYEDMFPCEIGDIVWQSKKVFNEFPYLPYPIKVSGYSICKNGTYLEGIYGIDNRECSILISEIGKSVFLTREQAEAELKKNEEVEE